MFINENHVLIVSECICYKNLILESLCYYEMDNFYVKFDLLELTAREISLILPILITNSIISIYDSFNVKENKVKKLNEFYKAALNYEFGLNQRDSVFYSRFQQVK